jgi:hypothetical protein
MKKHDLFQCISSSLRPVALVLWAFCAHAAAEVSPITSTADDISPCLRSKARTASTTPAFLDFDGDGLSELAFANSAEESTEFRTVSSRDGTVTSVSLGKGRAVPADYDSDGITDPAVVRLQGKSYIWEIKKSSDGATVTVRFGERGDTLVYGCRLLNANRAALAFRRGKSIVAVDLLSSTATRLGSPNLNSGEIIGCGDLAGDGTDEPLFIVPSRVKGLSALAGLSCRNQLVVYRSIQPFDNGGIIQLDRDDFPLLITLRPLAGNRIIANLTSFSELFPYPKFFLPDGVLFSSGRYQTIPADGVAAGFGYGVIYQDPKSGSVKRRLFGEAGIRVEELADAPAGFKLVRPQGVLK